MNLTDSNGVIATDNEAAPFNSAPWQRLLLFKLQSLLSAGLLIVALFYYGFAVPAGSPLKLVMAPFGAGSLLLFALFLVLGKRVHLADELRFPWLNVLGAALLVVVGTASMPFILNQLEDLGGTLERLIFVFSFFLGAVVFVYARYRNLWSMALLTAIGEGIAVALMFVER